MIIYITENEMLWMLRGACADGNYKDRTAYNIGRIERGKKVLHKYNESKGKRILQSKYLKAKCGTNHCYLEEDFEMFLSDYLNS